MPDTSAKKAADISQQSLFSALFLHKGDNAAETARKLIFLVSLVVLCAATVLFIVFCSKPAPEPIEYRSEGFLANLPAEKEIAVQPPKQSSVDFDSLLKINPDTVGYVHIKGTAIDYPVVKGTDNAYYLNHDFEGNENRSGAIMMDYRNISTPQKRSGNTILYGHHMAAGTMFAELVDYMYTLYDYNGEPSIQMYKEHPTITYDTPYESSEWKIFAVDYFNVKEKYGDAYRYNNKHEFKSREDFNDFIINVMDRSDLLTDVDVKYGDYILTLSTCCWPYSRDMNNCRLVVFARKVRPGESSEVNVDAASINEYAKRWQWVYDNYNGGVDWSKSVWDRRKLLSYTAKDAKKDGYTFPEN